MPPPLTVSQIRELDRHTIEDGGTPGRLLMETAGHGAFQALLAMPGGTEPTRPVLVAAGKGNNAGDGFVVARFLASRSIPVRVACVADPLKGPGGSDATENARLLAAYGVAIETLSAENAGSLARSCCAVVDALLGTGLQGPVRAPYDAIIDAINTSGRPVLALDLPSGLCGDTGRILGTCIRARCTVTFGALKWGLERGRGAEMAGTVELVSLPFLPPAS